MEIESIIVLAYSENINLKNKGELKNIKRPTFSCYNLVSELEKERFMVIP